MQRTKGIIVAACGAAVLAASGCSVEEATRITSTSATLNARVENPAANIEVAYAFVLAPVGTDLTVSLKPVGAPGLLSPLTPSAALSRQATGLEPDTDYHYSLCGFGQYLPLGNAIAQGCLPEKTFRTTRR